MKTDHLLLDTCTMIWLSQGVPIADAANEAIDQAFVGGGRICVSVMSSWELGLLVARGRISSTKPPERWFNEFLDVAAVELEEVNPRILVAASYLPGSVHNDPLDRILIATARDRDLTIVTRDRAILAYAQQGHVQALAC